MGNPPMRGTPLRPTTNDSRVHEDPPTLTEEEDVLILSPSPKRENRESPERWYSPATGVDTPAGNGEPSDSIEYYSAMSSLQYSSCEEDSSETAEYEDLDGYLAIEREMLARMNEYDVQEMAWQMTASVTLKHDTQSTRPAETHNAADGEPEVGSAIRNRDIKINTRLWLWPGRAMQQIILLRRCFYPRREVIKW